MILDTTKGEVQTWDRHPRAGRPDPPARFPARPDTPPGRRHRPDLLRDSRWAGVPDRGPGHGPVRGRTVVRRGAERSVAPARRAGAIGDGATRPPVAGPRHRPGSTGHSSHQPQGGRGGHRTGPGRPVVLDRRRGGRRDVAGDGRGAAVGFLPRPRRLRALSKASPDGRFLVTGSYDRTARVWEAPRASPPSPTSPPTSRPPPRPPGPLWGHTAAFTPDAARAIVTATGEWARVDLCSTGVKHRVHNRHAEAYHPPVPNGPGDILDLIRRGQATTRGDIRETTGLSRMTVSQRLDALLAAGMVVDGETGEATGGRRRRVLVFNHAHSRVLAAAVDTTHTRIAVTDLGGQVLADTEIDVPVATGPSTVLEPDRRGQQRAARQVRALPRRPVRRRAQPARSRRPCVWTSKPAAHPPGLGRLPGGRAPARHPSRRPRANRQRRRRRR